MKVFNVRCWHPNWWEEKFIWAYWINRQLVLRLQCLQSLHTLNYYIYINNCLACASKSTRKYNGFCAKKSSTTDKNVKLKHKITELLPVHHHTFGMTNISIPTLSFKIQHKKTITEINTLIKLIMNVKSSVWFMYYRFCQQITQTCSV